MSSLPLLRIDFVSDVACPWCAVGLASLEQAIERLRGQVNVQVHFQPFELNPAMPPEGQDAGEHLKAKYGMSDNELQASRERIRSAGEAVGFHFSEKRDRVWNTFAAHRLIHWAGRVANASEGEQAEGTFTAQHRLKKALLTIYHGHNQNPASPQSLLAAAGEAGLDLAAAQAVIDSDQYTGEVRHAQQQWLNAGIQSVPSTIINERHLLSGGQPSAVFEQVLRQVAGQA
jgi:predicted DsbA family dithiol-disulfide isomerase